jgi:hypothetical protein
MMMRIRIGIAAAAWVLAAVLGASSARGDGVCEKGYRDTTAAERATITSVLEAVKAALPPAPQGWIIVGDDQVSVPTNICRDAELNPWNYHFTRYYQQVDDQEADAQIIKAAAERSQADMAQKQPRLDALMTRMQAITEQQVALFQKGDYTGAAAMDEKLALVQAEYRKVVDEGDVAEQNEAAFREASRDQTMNIIVTVNPRTEGRREDARAFKPPAGAVSAFRWSGTRGDVKEDSALVLIGLWKPAASGSSGLVPRANVAASAAHSISVLIVADAGRITPTVDAIDFTSLAGIVSR